MKWATMDTVPLPLQLKKKISQVGIVTLVAKVFLKIPLACGSITRPSGRIFFLVEA